MGVFQAIASGIETTLRKPLVPAVLYVINVVFAAVVALPLLVIVQGELGHSFLGSNVRPLDLGWLGEAGLKYRDALPLLLAGLLAGALVYLGLQIFLNGGVVSRLLDREGRATLAVFIGDCARYFGRFARLFLVSLVFLVLVFGVVLPLVSSLTAPLRDNAATEWLPLVLRNLHVLVALLLLSIVRMIVDYARIAVVADEERKVLKAMRHALKFLGKNFFRAWSIYLLLVAGALAGTIVFYAVLGPLGAPSVPLLVAGFAWMQVYILFRVWMRTLFVSAQADFYRSRPY